MFVLGKGAGGGFTPAPILMFIADGFGVVREAAQSFDKPCTQLTSKRTLKYIAEPLLDAGREKSTDNINECYDV